MSSPYSRGSGEREGLGPSCHVEWLTGGGGGGGGSDGSTCHLNKHIYSRYSFDSTPLQCIVSTEQPYKLDIISFSRLENHDCSWLNITLQHHVFHGGTGIFMMSKITLVTTTSTCPSFQLGWNSAGLHSEVCSSMKFQANWIITFWFDRWAAFRRRGIHLRGLLLVKSEAVALIEVFQSSYSEVVSTPSWINEPP